MLAPHHGSKTSSSMAFVNAVHPGLTIFTAGYLNRFRHPRPEVITRYQGVTSEIMRTDYHGAVIMDFVADVPGGEVRALGWRKQNRRYWHDVYL